MSRLSIAVRFAQLLAVLLVCRTVLYVLLSYGDYLPPNFQSDFLLGRRGYFFGSYQWAFYVHITSGPLSLLLGLVLLSQTVRSRWPVCHRAVGRIQVVNILLLVAPSSLWMAWYAEGGTVAAAGLTTLAIATAVCITLGWLAAVQRRFDQHARWMQRTFALLCSAVVLRAIGGASEVLAIEGTYPYAAWLSWIVPLIVLEAMRSTVLQSFRHQQS